MATTSNLVAGLGTKRVVEVVEFNPNELRILRACGDHRVQFGVKATDFSILKNAKDEKAGEVLHLCYTSPFGKAGQTAPSYLIDVFATLDKDSNLVPSEDSTCNCDDCVKGQTAVALYNKFPLTPAQLEMAKREHMKRSFLGDVAIFGSIGDDRDTDQGYLSLDETTGEEVIVQVAMCKHLYFSWFWMTDPDFRKERGGK